MLKEAEYIEVQRSETQDLMAWALSAKGFKVFQTFLDADLHEVGWSSESFTHDFVTAAVHLGDWLYGIPQHASLFSEQELRRYDPTHYPSWVPKSFLHRPDGFLRRP